jgi:uncharacterized SAM-binding protein YcdF (DUF218 family)
VISVLAWILRAPICTFAGDALVEDDGAVKADAIVVLGGDAYGNRIIRAAELAKSGYAPIVMVSGPHNLVGNDSDTTILYATRKGYPASMFEAIPLPENINSTHAEEEYIGDKLREQRITSIDLVTSNYHTRRAAWLWRKINPGIRVNVVPAPDPYFSPGGWFRNREGKKTFLMEWLKTGAAHIGR